MGGPLRKHTDGVNYIESQKQARDVSMVECLSSILSKQDPWFSAQHGKAKDGKPSLGLPPPLLI